MAALCWEYIGLYSQVYKQIFPVHEAQQIDGLFVEGMWQGLCLILLQWSRCSGVPNTMLWGLGASFPPFRGAGLLILH